MPMSGSMKSPQAALPLNFATSDEEAMRALFERQWSRWHRAGPGGGGEAAQFSRPDRLGALGRRAGGAVGGFGVRQYRSFRR